MYKSLFIALSLYTLFIGNLAISTVFADETYLVGQVTSYSEVRFNNENWYTLPHPKVAEFTVRDDGSAYGLTETGVEFVQYNVPNDIGIRVQRFEIQDHYHYIVEGNIVDTFEQFSAFLAQAYTARMSAV